MAGVRSVNERNCNDRAVRVPCSHAGLAPVVSLFRTETRFQDVRSMEKDKVVMFKCFRPGDVVLARIVSGDDFIG